MTKCYLNNLTKLFVYIRYDIQYKNNLHLTDCICKSLSGDIDNHKLIMEVNKIQKNDLGFQSHWSLTENIDSYSIPNSDTIKKILLYALEHINSFFVDESYEKAYDFIDAIHCLPEIFASGNISHLKSYWKTYISPLRKKWGMSYFYEVKDMFFI